MTEKTQLRMQTRTRPRESVTKQFVIQQLLLYHKHSKHSWGSPLAPQDCKGPMLSCQMVFKLIYINSRPLFSVDRKITQVDIRSSKQFKSLPELQNAPHKDTPPKCYRELQQKIAQKNEYLHFYNHNFGAVFNYTIWVSISKVVPPSL